MELESSILENLNLPHCLFKNCGENIDELFTNIGISKENTEKAHIKRGSKYCLARWCNNSKRIDPDLALFRLPIRRDKERALKWLTNADRDDLKLKNIKYLHSKYLCAVHFTDVMFMNRSRKRLIWNAVPELFPVPENAVHFSRLGSTEQLGLGIPVTSGQHQRMILSKLPERSESATAVNISGPVVGKDQLNAMKSAHESKNNGTNIIVNGELFEITLDNILETNDTELWKEIFGSSGTNEIEINFEDCFNEPSILLNETEKTEVMTCPDLLQGVDGVETVCSAVGLEELSADMFPCPSCGDMFLVMSNLIRHQRTFHFQNI